MQRKPTSYFETPQKIIGTKILRQAKPLEKKKKLGQEKNSSLEIKIKSNSQERTRGYLN